MKILILEDEPPVAEYIRSLTESLLKEHITSLDVVHTLAEATRFMENQRIDLCLLDLNLSGDDGFDFLKQTLSRPFHTIVISAYTERAIEAFEYGVLDFVPKTIKPDRLRQAFDRLLGLEEPHRKTQYLFVRRNQQNIMVPLEKVHYFKADRYVVEVHLDDGSVEIIDKHLNALEVLLPTDFLRVHRSCIVKASRIQSFFYTSSGSCRLRLGDGEELPLSRDKIKLLKSLSLI